VRSAVRKGGRKGKGTQQAPGTSSECVMRVCAEVSARARSVLPVLVTSFDVAMRDRAFLEREYWRFIVVDEVRHVSRAYY
jgi:hypothetical protein